MSRATILQRRFLTTGRSRTWPIDDALLARISFTDHAIERFAERAGLQTTNRRIIEPIARAVLHLEGVVVHSRPDWARSQNSADVYLQAGQWMLFIACKDYRSGSGRISVVTVINNPRVPTWVKATRRGRTRSTAPGFRVERTGLMASAAAAMRLSRKDRPVDGLVSTIRRTHAERRIRAQTEYELRLANFSSAGGVYGARA
jgi:hypothetical protein